MAKFVDEKIIQRRIMLFSKKYVPACRKVKEILNSYNLSSKLFEVVEIESRQDVNQIENYFQVICLTDRREVPQLFIDEKYVGGQKEIVLLHRTGELEKLINEVLHKEEMSKIANEALEAGLKREAEKEEDEKINKAIEENEKK